MLYYYHFSVIQWSIPTRINPWHGSWLGYESTAFRNIPRLPYFDLHFFTFCQRNIQRDLATKNTYLINMFEIYWLFFIFYFLNSLWRECQLRSPQQPSRVYMSTRCQFYQLFTVSFYVRRTQKCKKRLMTFLRFGDLRLQKVLVNVLVKLTTDFLGEPFSRCYTECTRHDECSQNLVCAYIISIF